MTTEGKHQQGTRQQVFHWISTERGAMGALSPGALGFSQEKLVRILKNDFLSFTPSHVITETREMYAGLVYAIVGDANRHSAFIDRSQDAGRG